MKNFVWLNKSRQNQIRPVRTAEVKKFFEKWLTQMMILSGMDFITQIKKMTVLNMVGPA